VEITLDEHRRVLAAIEAGDRTAARDAMATHVQGAASRLNVEVKLGTKV
jgi:DNA-binding FadR family transcriptional regulator